MNTQPQPSPEESVLTADPAAELDYTRATEVVEIDPEDGKVYNQTPRFMHMRHLKMNVVEAAKARIRYILDNFEHPVVSFSGGKDSLVVLTLVEQIWKEDGRTGKINVKFMDEELVCDDIIDFVLWKADQNKDLYNFKWYCLEMYVGFFVMGKHKPFVTWTKDRPWHRKPPERDFVIYDIGVSTKDENENSISKWMYPDTSKQVIEMLGLRADESLRRFLAVRTGTDAAPNFINISPSTHIGSANPIYDWTEMDVFKFFKDHNVRYCSYYDVQVWAKAPLRVASTMHERAQGQFFKMKQLAPRYYEQLRSIYPEIETHYRYGKEMADVRNNDKYAHSFEGIRQYIRDEIDASHQDEAMKYVKMAESRRTNNLAKDPNMLLGGVSVRHIFAMVMGGKFVKGMGVATTITQEDLEYENVSQPAR